MKATFIGAGLAVLLACTPVSHAQEPPFQGEILEWVIEPCMEAGAALDVKPTRRRSRRASRTQAQVPERREPQPNFPSRSYARSGSAQFTGRK